MQMGDNYLKLSCCLTTATPIWVIQILRLEPEDIALLQYYAFDVSMLAVQHVLTGATPQCVQHVEHILKEFIIFLRRNLQSTQLMFIYILLTYDMTYS